MRPALALGLILAGLAAPALAEEAAADGFGLPLSQQTLDDQRGGSEVGPAVSDVQSLANLTSQTAANSGAILFNGDAAKLNGTIYSATVAGNQGITTVLQNTGDLVNLTNATSVNVYVR